jgi:hypothetical protein
MAIVKYPTKRGGPKTPTAIHDHSSPISYLINEAKETAN